MAKAILISVCNREISTEVFETFDGAKNQMEHEYFETIKDDDCVDDSEINEYSAWANIDDSDYQYDWMIVEV